MAIRLWPTDAEKATSLTKAQRFLAKQARKQLSGWFFADIDPLGMATERNHMGMCIIPEMGLLTFSIIDGDVELSFFESSTIINQTIEKRMHERLLESAMLITTDGTKKILKFPYKHIIILPAGIGTTLKELTVDMIEDLSKYVSVGFFKKLNGSNSDLKDWFSDVNVAYDPEYDEISERECIAIMQKLSPEYTVVFREKEEVETKKSSQTFSEAEYAITGKEIEYRSYMLDEEQVKIVNEVGFGHRVMLANAGAGKSVLLLSKAFKYANLHKDSRVLLTCYNHNLAEAYVFKKECARFYGKNNLSIMTFHALVKKLYKDVLKVSLPGEFPSETEIKQLLQYVTDGRVETRFKAIFIDEAQIFDPLYLDLCYALYEKTEDGVFLLSGDLNQTVRSQSRRGDAPWKKMKTQRLDFTGRVKYIKKNYRNSKEISDYLNRMLNYMNNHLSELSLINNKEFEYDLFGEGSRRGIALEVKTHIDRMNIKNEIVSAIQEICSKYHIGYTEIGILFPYKKSSHLKYFIMQWIKDAFNEQGIPFSTITTDESGHKDRYSSVNGITLSTIDSSLGLDFKAVIMCGLFPYNYVYSDNLKPKKLSSWKNIKSFSDNEKEAVAVQIRKIYTGCSRARDILYVLSDLDANSPVEDVLTQR